MLFAAAGAAATTMYAIPFLQLYYSYSLSKSLIPLNRLAVQCIEMQFKWGKISNHKWIYIHTVHVVLTKSRSTESDFMMKMCAVFMFCEFQINKIR